MNLIKKILADDVFKHGSMLFIGLMSFNVLNYFFHFAMGRMLGPSDYGVVGVLMSILYITNAPLTTIQTVVTKFTAQFKAENLNEKIKSLFVQSVKKMFLLSIVTTLIFITFSSYLAKFFNISDVKIVIFFSLLFLVIFIVAICRGILQGLEKFRTLSVSFLLEGIIKIILAVTLVYFGFKIYGAIGSLLITSTIILLFVISFLKRPKELKEIGSKEIYKYTVPVLISITIITLIQNIDVLLVKHYMSGVDAGLYVATSTLAKIVFFATMSFSFVMFPKVAGKFSTGRETLPVFKKSLMMVSAISVLALGVYLIAPKFIVLLLYGAQYVSAAGLLTLLGVTMVMLSFSYLIINYLLSINKFKFIYFLTFIFILETILIVFFHESLAEVVKILFATNAILLLYLTIDLVKNEIIPSNSRIQRRAVN